VSKKPKKLVKGIAIQKEVLISQIVEETMRTGISGHQLTIIVEEYIENKRLELKAVEERTPWQSLLLKLEVIFVAFFIPTFLVMITVLTFISCLGLGLALLYVTYSILETFFSLLGWLFN